MVGRRIACIDAANIERRAQKISDPIQRLRYLRRAGPSATNLSVAWRWAAFLALAIVIVPLGTFALSRKPMTRNESTTVRFVGTGTPVVWPVEQTSQYDLYSNGLRIEKKLSLSNQPRYYSLIGRESETPGPFRAQPAGIVFHITESDQAPFEASQKSALKR